MYRCLSNLVRISVGPHAVLTGFRNFSHSLQVNSETVPLLENDRFLPNPLQFITCHHRRVGRWRVFVTLIAS